MFVSSRLNNLTSTVMQEGRETKYLVPLFVLVFVSKTAGVM